MHRDRAYANESSISTHEHPTWSKTQSPLQFVDQGPTPPAKQPARYMVSNMMHLSLLPNHNKELTLSPPSIHRISSSPIPLRYECIGDPALKIFRLSLPRELVRRLDGIIALSEQFAQGLAGGWKTELYSLTKQDLPLRDIPGMALLICPIFDYIIQAIQVLYGCRRVIVDKNQPHILKYSLDTQHTGGEWQEQMHGMTVVDPNREFLMKFFLTKKPLVFIGILKTNTVQLHHDRCDVTANLVLSRSQDYAGGGTYIPDAGGRIFRLEQGEFLLHPGSLVHGGVDIQKGTRYLMVLFAHLKK